MPRTFKSSDMLKLIAIRTNLTEVTVNKIYEKLIDMILEELIRGGQVNLDGLGTFYTKESGGHDKLIYDRRLGKSLLRYVKPRLNCKFKASKKFQDKLNYVFEYQEDNLPKGSKDKAEIEAGLFNIKEQLVEMFEDISFVGGHKEYYCNDLTALDMSKQKVEEIK